MQLSECRALLTGASGGIGQALVERLCAGGARLLLAGRDGEALDESARRHPGQVMRVCADLRLREGREAIVDAARQLDGLNCVVHAAGVSEFRMLEQQEEDAIAAMISLNVTATLQLTCRLLPLLREAPRALIVTVGSIFGSIGYPGFATYCASKFAVRGFSEALRRELADSRIRVLYVAPRSTRTPMNGASVIALNEQLRMAMDDPGIVASRIAESIRHEREELYIGWPEKLFVRINGLLPRTVDQALRSNLPVVRRLANHDR